jgi:hypothetical protein
MAVVEEVFADKDGMVRQVMIRLNVGKFKGHACELCLVEEAKEVDDLAYTNVYIFVIVTRNQLNSYLF